LSPLIWTSIATGRKPLDHGILDFVINDPETGEQIPTTSNLRKVKALWNIVGEHGKTVGVLGWLVTWPAERVNGWLISDRYFSIWSKGDLSGARPASHLTYPKSLQDSLDALVSAALSANGLGLQEQIWNETHARRRTAISLLKNQTPDFAALYFSGVDRLGHLLLGNPDIEPTEARQEIEAMYTYLDTVLGEIVALADSNTTILLASDHGFYTAERGPPATAMIGSGHASEWHRDRGILVLKGPGIRPGAAFKSAHVLDIAPTVLALLDLPIPADAAGRVLREALTDQFVMQHPVDRIDTYEVDNQKASADEPRPLRSEQDSEIRKQLESLGYLNPESANSYNNVGLLYRQEGEFEKAIAAFQRAIEMAPDVAAFYDNLGVTYGASGDFAAAATAHRKALALDPTSAKAYNNLGNAYLELGKTRQAVQAFEKAVSLSPRFADAYANLASVYYRQGDFAKAETLLRKALSLEPGEARSHYNLAVMYGEQGQPQAAIEEFRAVLDTDPDASMAARAHNGLGVAYFRQGDYLAALKEFQEAVRLKPNLKGVHGRLGLAYLATGDFGRAKLEFERELSLDPQNEDIAASLRALEGMRK
jgi:tetratricopeptide (TPR) repeat protein